MVHWIKVVNKFKRSSKDGDYQIKPPALSVSHSPGWKQTEKGLELMNYPRRSGADLSLIYIMLLLSFWKSYNQFLCFLGFPHGQLRSLCFLWWWGFSSGARNRILAPRARALVLLAFTKRLTSDGALGFSIWPLQMLIWNGAGKKRRGVSIYTQGSKYLQEMNNVHKYNEIHGNVLC